MLNYSRYKKNPVIDYPGREWPNKEITKAPAWCSVDLRDGNQALIDPMDVNEKVELFLYLIKLGFKEIEIGFPAASQIEYDFLRQLVDRKLIPDDVIVQVLSQCREEQLDKIGLAVPAVTRIARQLAARGCPLSRDILSMEEAEQSITRAWKPDIRS